MNLLQNNTIKVGLALVVALMVIIYFNPPHTPCQSQVDIYDGEVKALSKAFDKAINMCRDHTDPGGCMPFIEVLEKHEQKYAEVGHQCQIELRRENLTRKWIVSSMEILVKAAWGSQPPASRAARNGWLELTQVVEFCRLRNNLESLYGEEAWQSFYNAVLGDLPGADKLGRNEAWARSILSDSCQYHL